MARNTASGLLTVFTNCFRHRTSSATNSLSNDAMSTVQSGPSDRQRDEPDRHDFSPSASPPEPAKKQEIVCLICAVTIRKDRFCRPCRKCKEPWCHDCIRNLFTGALKDSERMPARCCQNVIHHAVARDILDEKTLARYKLRYEEFCTPKPFYCPVPTCSTFIPPRKMKSADHYKRVACPTCATRLCIKCRQIAQQGHQCSTTQNTVLTKIRALKYKSCPKCGTGVLKMYGCDHIRCHCGAHWCWSCERSIDICFGNPCQAQLDDGVDPEPDTDDEEDFFEAENRAITVGPADGIPYDYPTPSELALASPEASGANMFVLPAPRPTTPPPEVIAQLFSFNPTAPLRPATNLPETRAEDDLVTPVAPPEPDTILPSTIAVPDQPVAVVEENLDDPDEHDWEYQDMDFGGEPADERWDVWGCAHKCQRLNHGDIHEKWLRLEDLECQNCFESVHLVKDGDPQKDGNVVDKLAWLCKKCGVVFCEQCRREIRAKRKQYTA